MTHIILLSIFAAQRPTPEATEHMPFFDHDGFVAVSSTSTRPEGPRRTAPEGWRTINELWEPRQLVKIQLPEGVTAGPYKVGSVTLYGLHAENADPRDGMGGAVFVEINTPASTREAGGNEAAFAAAVASGVSLYVPSATGGERRRIAAPVVAVSPVYSETFPADWDAEFTAQVDRETGRK